MSWGSWRDTPPGPSSSGLALAPRSACPLPADTEGPPAARAAGRGGGTWWNGTGQRLRVGMSCSQAQVRI